MTGALLSGRAFNVELATMRLSRGSLVADVGCGTGRASLSLARAGVRMLAIDPTFRLLQGFHRLRSAEPGDVSAWPLAGSGDCLPLRDGSVDGLVFMEVLEHIPDTRAMLREARRVLRPGGALCVAVPDAMSERIYGWLHPEYPKMAGHIHQFTEPAMREHLTACGFRVIEVRGENFEPALFWVLHSLLRSRFDFTGVPFDHSLATRLFERAFGLLGRVGLREPIRRLGARIFPKSRYFYAEVA